MNIDQPAAPNRLSQREQEMLNHHNRTRGYESEDAMLVDSGILDMLLEEAENTPPTLDWEDLI